jgi:hypothetical protein
MNNEIYFLNNAQIDIAKWDSVVGNASNSRVYAFSWYLSILNPNWHGLVYGDYQYVMPVVCSKKLGISYAYQPVYAQQHGIFPSSEPEITEQFISSLQKKFRFFNVSLNSLNRYEKKGMDVELRKNYTLSLYNNYNDIASQYNQHTKRYVRKSGLISGPPVQISSDDFMNFKIKNSDRSLKKDYIKRLKSIVNYSVESDAGEILGIYSGKNELCAVAFFLKDKERYTYLNSVSSAEGKQQRAMYAIIDSFIRQHANQPCLLDFEGSNIEGIARFFEGFGAKPEFYQHIKYNNLPWFLKLLKTR